MGAMKNKKEVKRLTLAQLIAAADQRDKDKLKVVEVKIPSLDGTLLFRAPSDEQLYDMMDELTADHTTKKVVDEYAKIIYACCDQLHEKQLYEELDVGDPVDIVFKVMNAGDILKVGDEVCSQNPIFENIEDEVKNA